MSWLIVLLATGAAAALFQPLRARLQRAVNRLLYGERDEPYAVLSDLGRRLDTSVDPAAMLPTVVETIARCERVLVTSTTMRATPRSGRDEHLKSNRAAVLGSAILGRRSVASPHIVCTAFLHVPQSRCGASFGGIAAEGVCSGVDFEVDSGYPPRRKK
jgi:hypothetical protein